MAKPNVIHKTDLVQYAKQCLAEKGIENFTLRAVAEKAGVAQGTVYYHFRTKEQLVLEMLQNICDTSWGNLSEGEHFDIKQALESAKSRCHFDSYFHKLLFTLTVSSFTNEKIRKQLVEMLDKENKSLSQNMKKQWSSSPIRGVSYDTWGIVMNAIIDGIALQALVSKDFPIDKTYEELEHLFIGLSEMEGGN